MRTTPWLIPRGWSLELRWRCISWIEGWFTAQSYQRRTLPFFCIADSLELKSYVIGHQKAISHADGTSALHDPSSGLDPTLPLLHNGSSYCEKWQLQKAMLAFNPTLELATSGRHFAKGSHYLMVTPSSSRPMAENFQRPHFD
ncbi:uncharacterized protein FRV6_09890 [Fusarium oxysporum]|uniref:Uncharacterized protein n=1 Tax=Fusarium oxysporum TaxID=5507 RepID=A0A2H3TAK7_FUSOX|nr:uncharacterized protein FRV6_09890 [Fusarium oxysporum]